MYINVHPDIKFFFRGQQYDTHQYKLGDKVIFLGTNLFGEQVFPSLQKSTVDLFNHYLEISEWEVVNIDRTGAILRTFSEESGLPIYTVTLPLFCFIPKALCTPEIASYYRSLTIPSELSLVISKIKSLNRKWIESQKEKGKNYALLLM